VLWCWARAWVPSSRRPYHYKPLAVWVFALDPRGPHYQPVASLDHKPANAKYNYDVIIVRASSGTVIEEAMGWDRSLPPLPPEGVVPVAPGDRHASTSCGPARRASLSALTADGQVAWRTALPRPHDIGTATPLAVGGTVYADSRIGWHPPRLPSERSAGPPL